MIHQPAPKRRALSNSEEPGASCERPGVFPVGGNVEESPAEDIISNQAGEVVPRALLTECKACLPAAHCAGQKVLPSDYWPKLC